MAETHDLTKAVGDIGKSLMQQSKYFTGYSRYTPEDKSYEKWPDSVDRVISMHEEKFASVLTPELQDAIDKSREGYERQLFLGAQRALQFAGPQIFQHETRLYNCATTYCDRSRFFAETMYVLLCGAGVGFSMQKHHVAKLPKVHRRYAKKSKVFTVPDSIEGWSDAVDVLMSSFFENGGNHPEYKGCNVHFDFSQIRPKGAYISGGFKAPGPDGLRQSLSLAEDMLNRAIRNRDEGNGTQLKPIECYDITMYIADAVLSGGVRRSATICLFSPDDEEMLYAKTGNWFIDNPQRARSNNSVLLVRDNTSWEQFYDIIERVKDWGEPGFVWAQSTEHVYNPCVEVGMYPVAPNGETGFQFCNLTEINGAMCKDRETLMEAVYGATVLGTLQAGYTNFAYLTDATRQITEREALIGAGITGWMNSPDVLFDTDNMRDAANYVRETNAHIADLIGINHAARCTVVKPSGNASTLLGCASGIHGEHSKRYLRNIQLNENDEVLRVFESTNPSLVEPSVWSAYGTDKMVSLPIEVEEGAWFKHELKGVRQLEYVKHAQQNWIEYGTNEELCVDPTLRHNVSNTIDVDDWDTVARYIYDNRAWFAGVSLMPEFGDRAFPQAPFQQVKTGKEIFDEWGEASMFASGLIVDAISAFGDLWKACSTVIFGDDSIDSEAHEDLLKRDWVRRANKFAYNYFANDLGDMTTCLKDCHLLHKWRQIERRIQPAEFVDEMGEQQYTEVDQMAGAGCAGGACDISHML